MDRTLALISGICVLLCACGVSEKQVVASTSDSSTVAPSASLNTSPEETVAACEDDSLPSEPFVRATSTEQAVLVQPDSRDSTRQYEVAMRVDHCGVGRGLVRRKLAGGAIEWIPFPEQFREGLTTFDVSPDDRFITYVEFDGEAGAVGVVRTFPEGAPVARSRRLTVEGGDTVCGAAEFPTDSTWAAYVCAAVPGQDLWVRLRAPIRGGRIIEDTVQFALRRLP